MTTNRREFLHHAAGALSGLAFVGCGLTSPAFSQEALRRREVVVNGKRVRTVDLHAHCHFPEANALLGLKVQFPSLVISPERIKAMDEQGIDIEALSLNPIFWSKAEPDLADQVVKLQNEKLAEICSAQSDRFVGLASVALQHPDLAAGQLEDGVKRLGLRGALIGGSVNGEELSDPKFHPFWAKAEQLGVVIFIHPQGTAELGEYLRQLYYDSMVFTPEGLRHLVAEVGASQIVMGTDYPFPWTRTAVDHILATPGLNDAERVAILGETAEKLLAIRPA